MLSNKRPRHDAPSDDSTSQLDPHLSTSNAEIPATTKATAAGCTNALSWLNGLSDEEAIALHHGLSKGTSTPKLMSLSEGLASRLSVCSNHEASRDGKFYVAWTTCLVSTLTPNKGGGSQGKRDGHPRYRIVVPKSKREGRSDQYNIVKSVVTPKNLDIFSKIVIPDKTGVVQPRIHCHHVAYNAKRAEPGFVPLGAVGISHLCDVVGCLRLDHLEYVSTHGDNTARQRCRGMILVILNDKIIAEDPCSHARVTTAPGKRVDIDSEVLRTCCRRVHIVVLGDSPWSELMEERHLQ